MGRTRSKMGARLSRNNNAVRKTRKSKGTKLGKSRNNNAKKDLGSENVVEGANSGFTNGGFDNSGSANIGMAWNSETNMDFNINSNAFEAQLEMVQEAAEFIRSKLPEGYPPIQIGIVCGSGCGGIADSLQEPNIIKCEDVPHFIKASVAGHAGLMHIGILRGKRAMVMQGRFHAYEGHEYGQAAFPIRVMKMLGAQRVILTMAVGGLNPNHNLGDLVVIRDHISLPAMAGLSPLRGTNDERMGPRFVAQNNHYDREMRKLAMSVAQKINFDFVREGNYFQTGGPNYESPLECKFMNMAGGDVVGMSDGHEVIVARHMDIKVLSISLICNMCIMDADDDRITNHEEVLETSRVRGKDLQKFVEEIVAQLDQSAKANELTQLDQSCGCKRK